MSPADRIKNWIDSLGEAWKDRLRGWMISWTFGGITDALEDMTPEQKTAVESITKELIDDPDTPPKVKAFLEQSTKRGNPLLIAAGIVMGVMMVLGLVTGTFRPIGKIFEYKQEGILHTFRLDPLSVITAWRRDPTKYAALFDDLKDQGWNDDRIEALKFFTLFYPSAGDLINWAAKEVFEPGMVERYGLSDEFGLLDLSMFAKAGVSEEQARNYWIAHWEHASYMQIREMIHRGVLSEGREMPTPPTTKAGWEARDAEGLKEAYDWYRLVEIPPFWRDRLTEMMFEVPTRVDVRRWWDMRTIDEERLRSIYHAQGYHGKDLDDYVLWTKVYVAFPDLIARWKNGWITLDDVKRELTGYGMPEARLDELIETKIKSTEGERTTTERDLTKTEIYKGVKKGLITWDEGIELLEDLGYDEDEADYILTVNVGVLEGSPDTYPEFLDMTQRWRKAAGMAAKIPTEELKRAAREVVKLTRDLGLLQAAVKEEEAKLIEVDVLPAKATAKRDELRVSLHRAEAELSAAKTNYDTLLAEWRHKA